MSSRPAATSELDAKRFEQDLKRRDYRVAKIIKRERKARAPAPYTTSKLQQDASNRLGMNPKRTMRIAQALYEGIALGKGGEDETVGLITYMRTDCLRLSAEAVEECREYIETHVRAEGAAREAQRVQEQEAERAGRARSDPPDADGFAARRGAELPDRRALRCTS